VRWNFEKYLLDSQGQPYRRFDPSVTPLDILPHIRELLEKESNVRKKFRGTKEAGLFLVNHGHVF
jgi:hypothetical protein